jgi:hypothetical protein
MNSVGFSSAMNAVVCPSILLFSSMIGATHRRDTRAHYHHDAPVKPHFICRDDGPALGGVRDHLGIKLGYFTQCVAYHISINIAGTDSRI